MSNICSKCGSEFNSAFCPTVIQGQKQYEGQDNWDANYPEIQTDLYSGI